MVPGILTVTPATRALPQASEVISVAITDLPSGIRIWRLAASCAHTLLAWHTSGPRRRDPGNCCGTRQVMALGSPAPRGLSALTASCTDDGVLPALRATGTGFAVTVVGALLAAKVSGGGATAGRPCGCQAATMKLGGSATGAVTLASFRRGRRWGAGMSRAPNGKPTAAMPRVMAWSAAAATLRLTSLMAWGKGAAINPANTGTVRVSIAALTSISFLGAASLCASGAVMI